MLDRMSAIDSLKSVINDYQNADNPLHLLPDNAKVVKIIELIIANDVQGLQTLINLCGHDFIDAVNLTTPEGATPLFEATRMRRLA
jgi:hypothetical protein